MRSSSSARPDSPSSSSSRLLRWPFRREPGGLSAPLARAESALLMAEVDGQGRLVSANDAFRTHFRLPANGQASCRASAWLLCDRLVAIDWQTWCEARPAIIELRIDDGEASLLSAYLMPPPAAVRGDSPPRDAQDGTGSVLIVGAPATEGQRRDDDSRRVATALQQSQAIIVFGLDGIVLHANENFCEAMGYTLEEIVGQHHRLFVTAAERDSDAYRAFWHKLGRGELDAGQYQRVGKGGRPVWIQASYNPILDRHGQPYKIVKYATDITAARREAADFAGQIAAIGRSQAVVEFDLDGHVRRVNDNFAHAMGYRADEVVGVHHRLFVDPAEHQSEEYRRFWERLSRGEFDSGQYRRLGKGGREVWLQASYNPIFDPTGRPVKIVKYATDITAERLRQAEIDGQMAAISRSQAVIEFDLHGVVLQANENFCRTMGYTLEEIQGTHHRRFVAPEEAASDAYRQFWQRLGDGRFESGQFRRFGNQGKEIWIQASYNPIFDPSGRPFKIVKYATDITAEKLAQADAAGQLAAISRSLAVIEFDLGGHVLRANENFCRTIGYPRDELVGVHHSRFVDFDQEDRGAYARFWEALRAGEHHSGQYRRLRRDGQPVWIQATYNPILDLNGRPWKIVKYATDVTEQVVAAMAVQQAVREAKRVTQQVQDGDLGSRVPVTGDDSPIAALCADLNGIVDVLSDLMTRIRASTAAINASAAEISVGNDNLAARTETQAASLETTAASMEQLTRAVQQNADNAAQADALARSASQTAARGGQLMTEVEARMTEISQASEQIASIVTVIDGLAFQTNLLALNAAVEAARAGEQGRGFAVVASEVRMLAQRSADSAREIRTLIDNSVQKVTSGNTLVGSAGHAMREIVAAVSRVSQIVGEITDASQAQSSGIAHVNQAVSQIDETTQLNATLVKQAKAATSALQAQIAQLAESIGRYSL